MSIKKKFITLITHPRYFLKRFRKGATIHVSYLWSQLTKRTHWDVCIGDTRIKLSFFHPYHHHLARIMSLGRYEKDLLKFWSDKISTSSAKVILDLGGYNGVFGLIAGKMRPEARIFIFEPDPISAAHIRCNIRLNELLNVEVVELAVSDTNGTKSFFTDFGHTGANLTTQGNITVPCTTLGAWCGERRVEPDLIKIDIEGAELQALRGMRFPSHASILLEVHQKFLPKFNDSAESLFAFIETKGFTMTRLDENFLTSHYWVTPEMTNDASQTTPTNDLAHK